jgi:hypothetical protein
MMAYIFILIIEYTKIKTMLGLFLVGLIFGGCNNDDTPSPLVEDNRSALVKLSSFDTNTTAGSEIVTYDYESKQMYITNGASNMIDIVDISNPASPVKFKSIDLASYGPSVQSVAAKSGTIAVAVGSASKTATKGKVVFFKADGTFIREVTVGYLPDMVTFNEDGTKVIVANEGEPDATSGTYVDAVGSIGIITVAINLIFCFTETWRIPGFCLIKSNEMNINFSTKVLFDLHW